MTTIRYVISSVLLWSSMAAAQAPQPQEKENARPDGPVPDFVAAQPFAIRGGDTKLERLLKERANSATSELRLRYGEFTSGRGSLDVMLDSARRARDSRLEVAGGPVHKLQILRQYLEFALAVEKRNQQRFDDGNFRRQDLEQTRYDRLDAEVQLLRAGAKLRGDRLAMPTIPPAANDTLPEFVKLKPLDIDPKEPELKRLLKERANCALIEARLRMEDQLTGRGRTELWHDAVRRARNCRLELGVDQKQCVELLRQFHDLHCVIPNSEEFKHRSGCYFPHYRYLLFYEKFLAELDLHRATATLEELGKVRAFGEPTEAPPAILPEFRNDEWGVPRFVLANLYDVNDSEPALQRLPKVRMNCAVNEVSCRYTEFRVGRGTLDVFLDSGRRARDARLALVDKPAQGLEILTEYLDFTSDIEKLNQARFDAGGLRQQDLEQTRYERLSAEIDLLRAKEN